MGLRPAALGELREAIERTRPLSPAQAAVLHDVVIHVYVGATRATVQADRSIVVDPLRGDAWYFAKSGFLGVLLEPVESASIIDVAPQPPPAPDQQQQQQPDDIQDFGQVRPPGGVLIKETWAGFAGFRFLRVGDVVVATGGDQPTRAPTVQELRAAVQATPAGQTLDLRVLRQGRIVDVPVNVSARPPWATDETITRQVQSRRLRPAELYWQTAFAPLMFKDDGML